ncbi:hypothetical protein KJ898_03340 [bacterium]|nr:hypothetical protein [bacterium]
MMTNVQSLPDIRELKTEVITEIIKDFGITKTAFFIREMMSHKTDYLEIKDRLFGEKSAAEIYAEISDWKKARSKG